MIQDDDSIVIDQVTNYSHFAEDVREACKLQKATNYVNRCNGYWDFTYYIRKKGEAIWKEHVIQVRETVTDVFALVGFSLLLERDKGEITFPHKLTIPSSVYQAI